MILVTGGWDGYQPLNSTEVKNCIFRQNGLLNLKVLDLSSSGDGWREVGMLPTARYGLRAAILGESMGQSLVDLRIVTQIWSRIQWLIIWRWKTKPSKCNIIAFKMQQVIHRSCPLCHGRRWRQCTRHGWGDKCHYSDIGLNTVAELNKIRKSGGPGRNALYRAVLQ